jgi:uncharacterized membrane protein YeaQ/YmgE (transglycosylase-associated protein family)
MGIIAWIIFGALAGWVASMIMGTNRRQGCLLDIVVGVVGAFIGGFMVEVLTGRNFNTRFNLSSFIVAVIGAVILLLILNLLRRARE